ncbi:hypothetical protein [Gloeothece verrucosa]|uniref:Uncharacterized protein n=1 Tax=Gloeothece verrucosa (strain PCC 7822) TaxID=497965 RepID=E0UMR0_GLOV7|nr:hypothetical protein [Gloeothece verrucosa]ADN18240.1 hypothetical protein Cyan7822_6457 [Gloeothece verrucosa PCC 7822]
MTNYLAAYYLDSCPLYWGLTTQKSEALFGPFDTTEEAWNFLNQFQNIIEELEKNPEQYPQAIKEKYLGFTSS